jgi:sugar-specific transcriptional regulator TrmB
MINEYFSNLWLNNKETEIFLTLYKFWTTRASTIAKYLNLERTNVYKILLSLVDLWLVITTTKSWVKNFYTDISLIKRYLEKKTNNMKKLESNFDLMISELQKTKNKESKLPKITIFDWESWVKNSYNDIYENVLKKWLIQIKLFASNTFESQTNLQNELKIQSNKFYLKLKEKSINIETFLWNWILIMENISKTTQIDSLSDLPASNSAVNIFLVWDIIYIMIFKENPFCIKIDSEDLGNTMHFLFDNLKVG